jgi:type VI secretion system secreted protein Hcp
VAETVHLTLTSNGKPIQGDSTQHSLGRDGTIECLSFSQGLFAPRQPGSMLPSGKRTFGPIVISKRIDSSTPLLAQLLCENKKVNGEFKFYRPHTTGDGTTEQFFTVEIKNAYVQSINLVSHALPGAGSAEPPMEEVTFVYPEITWTITDGGVTFHESWGGGR